MPVIEDDDLFDPPTPSRVKKPSNKIVHQPAGATWSLDRLPEVETFYQQTFKKRLPLANKGQGSIHNKWNYDHTNSADVSLNPSTSEGQQFAAKLKEMGVPFLAFTGAIPGVATGPHFHLGFPSRKTNKKFNVGAQRKKHSLASDDLFDSQTDDDLFDPVQGQHSPKVSEVRRSTTPQVSAIQKPQATAPVNPFSGVRGKAQAQAPISRGELLRAEDQVKAPAPRQRSLAQTATILPGVQQIINLLPEEDRENLVEGVTGAIAGTGKQLANTQNLGMQITGMRNLPGLNRLERIPQELSKASDALAQTIPENQALRPEPPTFAGKVRRGVGQGTGAAAVELPKLILGGRVLGAANLPVQGALSRADEGAAGIIKGAGMGLVYHFGGGVTGKYLGKVGNSLVWIAGPTAEQTLIHDRPLAESLGESIPMGIFAGATGAKKRGEPVLVKQGNGVRPAREADLPKIVSRELEIVPPAVEAAERRQIQREFDKIKERDVEAPDKANEAIRPRTVTVEEPVPKTVESVGERPPELNQRFQHIQFGKIEVLPDQTGARPGKVKVAEVADPTKQHFVKRSDMQGRGNARMIPIKSEIDLEAGIVKEDLGQVGKERPTPPVESRKVGRPAIAGEGTPLTPVTRETRPILAAISQTGSGDAYVVAGGQRLKVQQSNYGMFGRATAGDIHLADGSEVAAKLITRVEDSKGNALWEQPSTPSVREAAQLPEGGKIARGEPKETSVAAKTVDVPAAQEGAGQGMKEAPAPTIIPERPETIQAQLEARGYSLIPKGTPRPSLPQGYRAEKTVDGVVYYDPSRISAETIRTTPTTELLGHVEEKSPATTEAVVARTPEGTELHSSAVSPENLGRQIETTKANFPEAKVEAGDARLAEQVIKERLEPSITSARKETMAADRAELDLPELLQAERKSWQDTLDRAKVRGTKNASVLADEVLSSPRSLNEVETAQLVLRAQEIKNEHSRLMKEIGDEKNSESIAAKRPTIEALEREFDKLTQATKASGTEKGRALAAQKLTINQDYDLVSLVQRAKAAKGRDITPDERARYERIAAELEELKVKFAESEKANQSKQLQREIDRVIRRSKRAETKKELDDEFAMLAAQFAQARAQTKGIHSAGLAGIDPEGTLTPLIAKMARNRVRAGVIKAEEVVDHVYEALNGSLSKRDIRDAISGYGLERKGTPRAEDIKQLAAIKSELRKLSAQEDIEAGKRLTPQEKTRQTNLLKQEAELQRRLEEKDFEPRERKYLTYNKETQALLNRVNKLKGQYERELYRAQRGKLGVAWDIGVNIANVPKSLKSMGDVSAVLRQGGYFSITHPVLSTKAGIDMLRSFSDTGFRNVEREIASHKDFDLAKRSGVEFTGMEKDNPNLSKREESYLGSDIIDRASEIPIAGQAVKPVKAVKDFSERTFVSFLDSQRMQVFSRFADHIRSLKMSPKEEAKAMKAMAKFVNIGTGRGSLGKSGNQIAPALNVLMFSPRLLASRVQLMNKMVNPVAIARMPKGARSQIIKDNVKFAGTIATALGLAKAAGAGVSLDPDDADFLKIRIGNSRYDILTGLQQPMRFIYRMARAVQADITGDETYAGETKSALADRFRRSKSAPLAGAVETYIRNEDFKGRKFKLSRELVDLVTPLYLNDFKEAMKEDGVVGALVKTSPALVGVGAQTYKDAPEKPHTHAEKLARKFVRAKMPDNARTEEQIDVDQTKADLRAKSRRGEDVTKELEALGAKITPRQVKSILDSRNKTRLQEDVNRLSAKDAIIVWSVMNPGQREETKSILQHKATLVDNLPEEQQADLRRLYADAGIDAAAQRPRRATGFKRAFQRQAGQQATAP